MTRKRRFFPSAVLSTNTIIDIGPVSRGDTLRKRALFHWRAGRCRSQSLGAAVN
jgi:hypothetical protein